MRTLICGALLLLVGRLDAATSTTVTSSTTSTTQTTMHVLRKLDAARDAWQDANPDRTPTPGELDAIQRRARQLPESEVQSRERTRAKRIEKAQKVMRDRPATRNP